MLTRIVRPSPALEAFLQPLTAHLSQPQRQHLLELADALLVCEDRKTLAALQRQFLDTTDPSNWADFLRLSPWSADLVRGALRRRHLRSVPGRGLTRLCPPGQRLAFRSKTALARAIRESLRPLLPAGWTIYVQFDSW